MDIVTILDSLAAMLVILTVIGFGLVGVYLAYKDYKEGKRRKINGIKR
jgi:hypothetical protein